MILKTVSRVFVLLISVLAAFAVAPSALAAENFPTPPCPQAVQNGVAVHVCPLNSFQPPKACPVVATKDGAVNLCTSPRCVKIVNDTRIYSCGPFKGHRIHLKP